MLQHLYEPKQKSRMAAIKGSGNPVLSKFIKELNDRRRAFQDHGNAVQASALQEVEQEREVAFEVEAVRQVKKAPQYLPLTFGGLSRDLESFARTGRLAADSHAYRHVLAAVSNTTLGRKLGIFKGASSSKLFVSSEFERTIKNGIEATNDNYLVSDRAPAGEMLRFAKSPVQRPVNWVLWSHVSEAAIIVIPEEAELLIPILRQAKSGEAVLITYSAPVTRKMLHFNRLQFYSIPVLPANWVAPQWLTTELGIFAGRLYFEWHDYKAIRQFLGMSEDASDAGGELDEEWSMLGFDGVSEVPPISKRAHDVAHLPKAAAVIKEVVEGATAEGTATNGCPGDAEYPSGSATALEQAPGAESNGGKPPLRLFTPKPLQFLREWLAVRRRGQDFTPTPMGFITEGKPLDKHHPFFEKVETEQASLPLQVPVARRAAAKDDDVDEEAGDDIIVADDGEETDSETDEAVVYSDDEMYSAGEEDKEDPVHAHPGPAGKRRR